MSVQYSPGSHPVAVTPHGFVVLAEDASPALASRIHALVADGRGLGGVIEALTGAYGTSLSAVPSFAVALAERGAVRLAVRGGFALEVESGASERISGEGVTTWTERVIPEVSRVSLVSGADAEPAEYPMTDGVVLAESLAWVPGAAVSPASPVSPVSRPAKAAAADVDAETPAGGTSSSGAAAAPAAAVPDAARAAASAEAEAPAEASVPDTGEADLETIASVRSIARASAAAAPDRGSVDVPASAPEASVPATPDARDSADLASPLLIDSAAVLSLADTLLPADSTLAPPAEPAPASAEPAQPSAWEATVVRPQDAIGSPIVQGDHDGETISVAEARSLRGADSAPPPLAPPRPPAPGRIRVSTGQVMTLDRTVVIGRRPRSTRVSGTDLPHLVAVDSPQQDISRSHVELRVEGDSIVATDLHTTNGTTLLRSGVDPMRLHPGEGMVVVPGDVIDLGDGITVAIEELP